MKMSKRPMGIRKITAIDVARIQTIKKAIKDAEKHDKHSCNCEGCKYWWIIPVRMHASGMLYEIFPLSENHHTPLSFSHEHQIMLGLVINKGLPVIRYIFYGRHQFLTRLI